MTNIKEETFAIHRDSLHCTQKQRKKNKQMTTKLARIAELSAQNPNMVFTSIAHMINVELLRECHRDKAVGIDGVTKEEYCKRQWSSDC